MGVAVGVGIFDFGPTPKFPAEYPSRSMKVGQLHQLVVPSLMQVGIMALQMLVQLTEWEFTDIELVEEMKLHDYWKLPHQQLGFENLCTLASSLLG